MGALPENVTLQEYYQWLSQVPRRDYQTALDVAHQKAQLLSILEHLERCLTL